MTKVKVCGITRLEDARSAVEAGVDALGFVFYSQSPRYIHPEKARNIVGRLPPFVISVGVFVNEEASVIRDVIQASGVQVIQLHGDESPAFCRQFPTKVIKAFRMQETTDLHKTISGYRVDAVLLDTYAPDVIGGTGKSFPWDLATKAKTCGPVILAGGLTPENVAEAIKRVAPYAVDVSSGVETRPGKKDGARIKDFVQRVRQCNE